MGWIAAIADALDAVEPSNTWRSLLDLFDPDQHHLIVLDHAGTSANGLTFQIRLTGDTAPRWQRTLSSGVFDVEQVVGADPLDGVSSLFTTVGGQRFEVRADFGPGAIPVQSLLELDAASLGEGFLAIPPDGPARLHLQVLDLASWHPSPSSPSSIAR